MIKASHAQAMLDITAATAAALDTHRAAEFFASSISAVIDVDYAVYCEHAALDDSPLRITVSPEFTPIPGTWECLVKFASADPWMAHVRATGDLGARRWTDLPAGAALDRNPLVQELYRPAGTDHILHAPIRWGRDTHTVVTLSRHGMAGFTDSECERLAVLCRALGRIDRWMAPQDGRSGSSAGMITTRTISATAPLLSPRQAQLAGMLIEGLGDKQIAHRLGITERTAKKHLTVLRGRLGAPNRVAAAAMLARLMEGGPSSTEPGHMRECKPKLNGST